MRIRSFSKFIEFNEMKPLVLQDSTVVIDGMNFFYQTYLDSQLPSQFGCECHLYASYLRERLSMFKKANINCYFIFKGGHQYKEDMKISSLSTVPIFERNIYKAVLDEMEFRHVTCEYESKKDIIELAQTLDCPVISYDIEFCFSGVQYIPSNELKFNEIDNTINCRYFSLDKFMDKYKYTAEKIALFIVLTDENVFPEDFFLNFFKRIHAPLDWYKRNSRLMYWLLKNNRETILEMVSQFVNAEEMEEFVEEVAYTQQTIGKREAGGLGAAIMLDRGAGTVVRCDPKWFSKGIAANHIAITYINLYRHKKFYTFGIDTVLVDPMFLSLDILKYVYNLLTNFQNDGFTFVYLGKSERESMVVSEMYSIRKPEYEASVCVFENGWDEVRELGLFQHFLKECLQLVHLELLDKLPEDAQLLVIALVYFSRKKSVDTSTEAFSVLLSYITLSLVREKRDKNNVPKFPFPSKPILEPTTDKNTVTDADCNIAAALITEYLTLDNIGNGEHEYIEILNPLLEFQYCLNHLNDLNLLCGAPFTPTVYSRTYSGTLVFRLRHSAGAGNSQPFFEKLLSPAPTVYAFLNGLIKVYESLLVFQE